MNTLTREESIDKQAVRDAVCRFLNDDSTRSYVRKEIKASIHAVLRTIQEAGWEAYLVGGTVRDAVLGPRIVGSSAYHPRDIDIILVGVGQPEVRERFNELWNRETRFGGAHLVDKKQGGLEVLFDIWSLADTWAFKKKVTGLPVSISFFPQTAFLNLDAVAVEIQSHRGKPRRLFESGFINGINDRMIEINFEPNPYPSICMVRALIMAAKLQFAIGPHLMDFALRQARTTSISELMTAQHSHYGVQRCSAQELSGWIRSLQEAAVKGVAHPKLLVHAARQLTLWDGYPPLDGEAERDAASSDLIYA